MRAYRDDKDTALLLIIDRPIVTSDVDASAARICPFDGMIVQNNVIGFTQEQCNTLVKLLPKPWGQFLQFLFCVGVKKNVHLLIIQPFFHLCN